MSTAVPRSGTPARAIGVGIALTAAALVFATVLSMIVLVPVFSLGLGLEHTGAFLSLMVAGQLGFFVVAYVYVRRRSMHIPIETPSKRDLGYVVVGIVAALVMAMVASGVLNALDLLPGSVLEDLATANPTILLVLAVLSVFVVAPIEEYLFRGVIQGRLRESFGPVGAITGASLLFGSVHLANYTGSLSAAAAGALVIAIGGAVLGIIYERTRNLTVPILAHAIYNVILSVSAYVTM